MTPREIIAAAWAITTKEPSLRRWSFTSSLLEMLFSIKLIGYQLYFAYKFFFAGGEAGFFDVEILLYRSVPHTVFFTILTIFILMVIIEFFIPHLCLGAMIGLAAKSYRKEKVKGGLVLGLYNYFQIFAIHEFLTLSSFSMLVTIISLLLRYVDGPIRDLAIIVAICLFLFSLILKFFFSFAQEAVVTQKLGIFEAIGRSFKLIVSHLGHIVFLLLLLFVISLRIVINAIVVVLIPAIIVGLALFLATIFPATISYSIAGVVGLALIIAASYMFAYIHAFKVTVWTITYLELIKHKDLDVIVGGDTI
jgi:hypothetical protein